MEMIMEQSVHLCQGRYESILKSVMNHTTYQAAWPDLKYQTMHKVNTTLQTILERSEGDIQSFQSHTNERPGCRTQADRVGGRRARELYFNHCILIIRKTHTICSWNKSLSPIKSIAGAQLHLLACTGYKSWARAKSTRTKSMCFLSVPSFLSGAIGAPAFLQACGLLPGF